MFGQSLSFDSGLLLIPSDVAASQNRAMIGPMIEIRSTQGMESEHAFEQFICALCLYRKGILSREEIQLAIKFATSRIAIE